MRAAIASCHDDALDRRNDVLDGEAEVLEQHAGRRRFAEAVDADHGASIVEAPTYLRQKSVTPASTATRGTPRGSTLRDTPRPGGRTRSVHGIDTTRTAMPSLASASRAPIARRTSEPVAMMTTRVAPGGPVARARSRRARCRRSARRRAAGRAGSAARKSGTTGRPALDRRASTRPPFRPCRTGARRPCRESGAGWRACSTDWCVGPSSPRPIESCVKTKIERGFISAAMRSALRA